MRISTTVNRQSIDPVNLSLCTKVGTHQNQQSTYNWTLSWHKNIMFNQYGPGPIWGSGAQAWSMWFFGITLPLLFEEL